MIKYEKSLSRKEWCHKLNPGATFMCDSEVFIKIEEVKRSGSHDNNDYNVVRLIDGSLHGFTGNCLEVIVVDIELKII